MNNNEHLLEMIESRLSQGGDKAAFIYSELTGVDEIVTFSQLHQSALTIAAHLQAQFEQGDAILLVLPTGVDFVKVFFAALLAGVLPTPLPMPRHQKDRVSFERLLGAQQVSQAKAVISCHEGIELLDGATGSMLLLDVRNLGGDPQLWQCPQVNPLDTAYLQFTSGSCGSPRGVELSHQAVMANLGTIKTAFKLHDESIYLTWLPLYHDMGLVGHLLQPLFSGGTSILLPTRLFSKDPLNWLRAMDKYRATTTGGPAFAFDLCATAANAESAELDLSCWQSAYVGADNVPPVVLERFSQTFNNRGFASQAWLPCYGLAEVTLFVAGDHQRYELQLDAARLSQGHAVEGDPRQGIRRIFGYHLNDDFDVKIVDPKLLSECSVRCVGEVWLKGEAVGLGYRGIDDGRFNQSLDGLDGYLRTGDLGFIDNGRLFLTGRLKDLIIVRGVNHYPEDIERTVLAADPGPATFRAACFAVNRNGQDALVVLRESRRRNAIESRIAAITERIAEVHAITPYEVLLVPPGAIERTSSGKTSRSACQSAYLANRYYQYQVNVDNGSADIDDNGKVAVIGMACRFPGKATDLDGFWQGLCEGVDSITETPLERWDPDEYYVEQSAVPGKMNTRWGGYVEQVDLFDPQFFGISGHEALEMDPQQRLLLEVAWRAFEHAGVVENEFKGSNTGVYVGISNGDYLRLKVRSHSGLDHFNAYSGLGNAYSIAANRLSYLFDFHGPSVAVDTACSSSLTAIHMASQAVRNGECEMALAGGVNLLLAPDATILLAQFGMMAPDGRCKAFDAKADGYVRSEGCGLVLLKKQSAALADGDKVLAWIRGSAQAQDGRSNGITSPNPKAQKRLLLNALNNAGVNAEQVTYIEAHGTGTAVGDPVEMAQLKTVYGGHSGTSCFVGSVKANIGHLEAAAGVAGFIKLMLMMQKEQIPAQLHLEQPNPQIDLADSRFVIPTALEPWSGQKLAAISSFGFGGALVHMLVEQATPSTVEPPSTQPGDHHQLLMLSAKTPAALEEVRQQWIEMLTRQRFDSVRQLCRAQALNRSHFDCRLMVVSSAQAGFRSALKDAEIVQTQAHSGNTVFMFSGQSGHYTSMGKSLYHEYEVFRQAFDRCAQVFDTPGSATLATITFGPETDPDAKGLTLLDRHVQPALFALEYALAQLWMSFGMIPNVLVGHSLGEIVAACVAGCMTPEQGMALVELRGRLMTNAAGNGAMLSILGKVDDISRRIDMSAMGLSVAALNAPDLTVISGPLAEIEKAREILAKYNIKSRKLDVSHAFHSAMMDPIVDEFEQFAKQIDFKPPTMPLISAVTGQQMHHAPTASFYREHLRHCVRFGEALEMVNRRDIQTYIEIGPGRAMTAFARHARPKDQLVVCQSLDEDGFGRQTLFESLGRLYLAGVDVDWSSVYNGKAHEYFALPGHPFTRQRYWFDEIPQALASQPLNGKRGIYDVNWVPRALPAEIEQRSSKATGWILVGDGDGFAGELESKLLAEHDSVFLLRPSGRSRLSRELASLVGGRGRYDIKVDIDCDRRGYATVFNHIITKLAKFEISRWRVIYLAALDCTAAQKTSAETLEQDQANGGVAGLTALVQGLTEVTFTTALWVVTRNAHLITADDGCNLSQLPVWGLMRTAFLEHPEFRGGLVDLDQNVDSEAQVEHLLSLIHQGIDEAQVAFRGGERFVQMFQPSAEQPPKPLQLSAEKVYLITGGMGGIGLCCAKWLAKCGVRRIALIGRQTPPAQHEPDSRWQKVTQIIDALTADGVEITTHGLDIRAHQQVNSLFDALRAVQPIGGIIHAAGINWFAKVEQMEKQSLLDAVAIKVSAAWHLHQQSLNDELDLFVMCSSVSALWGSVDLAHYTAANYFLDGLCRLRLALGLPSVCIDWGPWAEVGMSAKEQETRLLEMLGLELIPPDEAIAAMAQQVAYNTGQRAIVDFNWSRFQSFVNFSLSPSLFEGIRNEQKQSMVAGESISEIAHMEAGAAKDALLQIMRMQLSTVLHGAAQKAQDENTRFNFMGMDSLTAMAFCARLEARLGLDISAMTVYNYPTLGKMAEYLYSQCLEAVGGEVKRRTTGNVSGNLFQVVDDKRYILFCFPYAGAGPSVFANWPEALSADTQVVPLELPGRENRINEPAQTDMKQLIEDIADAVAPYSDKPFGFFGHSLGGLLSFEVTRTLAQRGLPMPQPLIISGCIPPNARAQEFLHRLDDDKLLGELSKRFGIVPENGWDEDLQQALLPTLRADMQLSENAVIADAEPLACQSIIFAGEQDPLAPPDALQSWRQYFVEAPLIEIFNGDHMFIRTAAKTDVLGALNRLVGGQSKG